MIAHGIPRTSPRHDQVVAGDVAPRSHALVLSRASAGCAAACTTSCCNVSGVRSSCSDRARSAVGLVKRADDDDRDLRGDPPPVPDHAAGGELVHRQHRPAHGGGDAAQVVGVGREHDPAPVDHDHPLEQPGRLVDQVGGEQDRAGMLGVVGQQPVVEDLPGHRVEARVGLVEHGHLRPGGEADHDPERRAHSPGQLLDRPARRAARSRPAGRPPARRSSAGRTTTRPAARA